MADASQEPPTLARFQDHEIYPMPMFATIAVADVAAASARNPNPDPAQAARLQAMFDAARTSST
jgi:hypothetical protein